MNPSLEPSTISAESYRRIPLEVFQCRHCDKATQSSEKYLRDALLCLECFNIRETYRSEHPRESSVKTETNCLGDQYGKNNRAIKAVVCADCGEVYELVPANYTDVSIEEQKSYYDRAVAFNNLSGNVIKSFKPIMLDYKNAPKGWINEILCKNCFDNFQVKYEQEIKQQSQIESERLQSDVVRNKNNEIIRKHNDKVDDISARVGYAIILIFIVFPLIFLNKCTSSTSENSDPSEMYYRK